MIEPQKMARTVRLQRGPRNPREPALADIGPVDSDQPTRATKNVAPHAMDVQTSWDRPLLRAVVTLNGGVRRVGKVSNVAPGNLSRWLSGGTGMSAAALARILETVALPDGRPVRNSVMGWTIGATLPTEALATALRVYFPSGAYVARAQPHAGAYSQFRKENPVVRNVDVLALSDGAIHAVLRLVPGYALPMDSIHGLKWVGGYARTASFTVPDGWARWIGLEPLGLRDFVSSWSTDVHEPNDDDVLATVRRLGMTNAEAIDRLRGLL